MPFGAGLIKGLVNIFGARQFHPILQTNALAKYYINYYVSANVGALIGGILIPIMCQKNMTETLLNFTAQMLVLLSAVSKLTAPT